MTVSELIEHLKQFHPDLPVYTQIDPVDGFHFEAELGDIYKTRLSQGWACDEPGISHEAVII